MMNSSGKFHQDLIAACEYAYKPSGFACTNITQEAESHEYGACSFAIAGKIVQFRAAKVTPKKIGQFVTLWKRSAKGPIAPYDLADNVDFFIVSVRTLHHFGQFVFPKATLYQKGIISQAEKGGKRAMRVYPAWDRPNSLQAKKTQAWQLKYFFEISPDSPIDTKRVRKLFGLDSQSSDL